MDKYKDAIKAAINNAITNNYVDFSKNIQQAVQLKTNEHPGVQAYKEDMAHYQGISNALSSVGDYEKKEEPSPTDETNDVVKDENTVSEVPENEETSTDDESEDDNENKESEEIEV